VDGVWTVEPWVSRLELEARAERILSQDDAFITLLATGRRALLKKSELLAKLVAAHEALTAKLNADPEAAKTMVNAAFEKTTTRAIPQNVLDRAWSRIKFTTAINRADFEGAMNDANAAGLLPKTENLDRLFVKP
jgi:NitT/TauT family transport system substrate-binding protein